MSTTTTTILSALQEEMEDTIRTGDPTKNYRTDPVAILRGTVNMLNIKDYPVVCFRVEEEIPTDFFGDAGDYNLHFTIYGFAKTDMIDGADYILDLAHDCLYFLFNDFSYASDIREIGEVVYSEGNVDRPSMFAFDVYLKYAYTNTNI